MHFACSGVQPSSEQSLNLLPLLPLSALLAESRVLLDVASGAVVALDVASSAAVLPRVFALPVQFSSSVVLVATFLGIFRNRVPRMWTRVSA
jgi:hypothetical protein